MSHDGIGPTSLGLDGVFFEVVWSTWTLFWWRALRQMDSALPTHFTEFDYFNIPDLNYNILPYHIILTIYSYTSSSITLYVISSYMD